jgi:Arc/MetJ-type ribon-helix-helix transcriptional regulator
MSDADVVIRKKRGRPRVGQTPVVSFRLAPEWQQEIDEWRSGEPDHPSRSDAIRILLAMGLSAAYAERKQAERKEE